MDGSIHQAVSTKNDLATRRKSDTTAGGKFIVSFEDNNAIANTGSRTNQQDKLKNHSQGSLSKGLEVIAPSKLNSTKDTVSFDKNSNSAPHSSPHMVSNSYILTASEDENEVTETVDSGGYFSRKEASARKFSFERRGTVNTINTNIDDDDDEEQTHHINFTHDAFDKYVFFYFLG